MAEATFARQSDGTRSRDAFTWARHPAPLPPWVLQQALMAAELDPGGLLVDPFAGTASTGTRVCGRGDRFIGIEAHPLTADLAAMKFARPGPPEELREVAEQVVAEARHMASRVSLEREHPSIRETLPHQALAELAAFRDVASKVENWRHHLRWAMLAALRDIAGSRWPKGASPSRQAFGCSYELVLRNARRMADDLELAPRRPDGLLLHSDSRTDAAWPLPPSSVDACVSSPPYFNQVAYAEAPRLEMYFLGMAHTWAELMAQSSLLMSSCVQQVTAASAESGYARLTSFSGTIARVERASAELRSAGSTRVQPKRYDHLLPAYCADIAGVLQRVYRALKPGGRGAWVIGESAPYGVLIDTPGLVAELATAIGFEMVDDFAVGVRGHRWPGVGSRHARTLSERLIVFCRPFNSIQPALPGMERGV